MCREILVKYNKAADNPYFCKDCYGKLKFIREPYCEKCSKPLMKGEEARCSDCGENETAFEYGRAILSHDDLSKTIIYGMKFSGIKDNADGPAYEIASHLGKWIESLKADAVIPIPLHKKKLRFRGFNQAQLLAEKISLYMEEKGMVFPPVDTEYLVRSLGTRPQKELEPDKRQANVSGAFAVSGEYGRYKTIILLDDIYTTGATLNECAETLKNSGAEKIYFLTISVGR